MARRRRKGHLIIISGPSGVGKGTVCRALMKMEPDLKLSISVTTRKRRPNELDGDQYFFYSMEDFNRLIAKKELIEFAKVHGNYYGTPKQYVLDQLQAGHDVILEIDVQGARQVKENLEEGVFIFLVPPRIHDLVQRLHQRGTENEEEIALRLHNSKEEMQELNEYDYAVVNEDVQACAETILHIIDAENQRVDQDFMRFYWEEYHD